MSKGWTHIKRNGGMGLQEQWILKVGTAPVCSLKRGEDAGTWAASLLHITGISTTMLHVAEGVLEQAQRRCETELRLMGWGDAMAT
jgi:hypothetical protein